MGYSKISIIVALTPQRVIGDSKANKMLWHVSEDFKRFKALTMGHPIIMGRKTHESIGKVLPGRTNIIVTSNSKYQADESIIASTLQEAIEIARDEPGAEEIFIIGGGEIYKQSIDLVDKLYITLIEKEFTGDVTFPDYSKFNKIIFEQAGESEELKYKFLELERS